MMPLGTAITVDGTELAEVIYTIERHARALNRKMPEVAEILVSAVDDVYEAEGPGWEPLAESTMRQRRGSTAKILQDYGIMAKSTTPFTGSSWAEARATVGYARYHASGTSNMPQRNPFDLGPFERDVLDDIADLLLTEIVP